MRAEDVCRALFVFYPPCGGPAAALRQIHDGRMCFAMDKIDATLLSILKDNARIPVKAITGKVFLSAPAVSARIAKLERQGVIRGYHAQLDNVKLGYHITAFISLNALPSAEPEFYDFISACPNVIECNCVTGDFSMLIKVAFPSAMELNTFVNRLQRFGSTSTQFVFSTPVEIGRASCRERV